MCVHTLQTTTASAFSPPLVAFTLMLFFCGVLFREAVRNNSSALQSSILRFYRCKVTISFTTDLKRMNQLLLVCAVLLFVASATAFQFPGRMVANSRIFMTNDLTIGDFEGVKTFEKISDINGKIKKYVLEATISKKELNSYLDEYKEEMKRRKVVFPGFRSGKLPPYVMGDVRKYLVCFGLETILGSLCNNNGLKMCTESGEEVPFGEDAYYQQIVVKDFREYDFQKQRDAWKEGTDFSFKAEFFAEVEEAAVEAEAEAAVSNIVDVEAEVKN